MSNKPVRVNYNALPHIRLFVGSGGKPVTRQDVLDFFVKYACGSIQTTLEDTFSKVRWRGLTSFNLKQDAKGNTASVATAFEVSDQGGPTQIVDYEITHMFGGPALTLEKVELKASVDRKSFETKKTRTLDTRETSAHIGKVIYAWADRVAQDAMVFYEESAMTRAASKLAKNIPADVERYVKEHKEQGNDEGKSWALAWSRFCKFKDPGSDHCQQGDYFTGKSATLESAGFRFAGTGIPELHTPAAVAWLGKTVMKASPRDSKDPKTKTLMFPSRHLPRNHPAFDPKFSMATLTLPEIPPETLALMVPNNLFAGMKAILNLPADITKPDIAKSIGIRYT